MQIQGERVVLIGRRRSRDQPAARTRRFAAFEFEFPSEFWSTESPPSTRHPMPISSNLNDFGNFNWI